MDDKQWRIDRFVVSFFARRSLIKTLETYREMFHVSSRLVAPGYATFCPGVARSICRSRCGGEACAGISHTDTVKSNSTPTHICRDGAARTGHRAEGEKDYRDTMEERAR